MELEVKEIIQSAHVAIPEPSLRRLPNYLKHLRLLQVRGREYVSSTTLANDLGQTNTQVVKDLAYTKAAGRPRVGYSVTELIEAIETFLGFRNTRNALLVGAGNLGRAIVSYQGFEDYGFNIVAAFDNDPAKAGRKLGHIEVLPMDKFRDFVGRTHIQIAILTCPPSAAQQTADLLVAWGVRAIWNFTPVPLQLPEHIVVENTSLYESLAVLINNLEKLNRR